MDGLRPSSQPAIDAESPADDPELWTQLDRPFGWTDLLLPEHELEQIWGIAGRVHERATAHVEPGDPVGVICVFVGRRGTGKTMAAQILGRVLARVVFEVDLRRVDINDEATIEAVFAAAERANAILVFDANSPPPRPGSESGAVASPTFDLSALLQRCWRYPGLVIFTWLPRPFFTRALATLAPALGQPSVGTPVRFPLPSTATRLQLWRAALRPEPQSAQLDLEHLAQSYTLSGGEIRDCCRAAVTTALERQVPLDTELLVEAIKTAHHDAAVSEPPHPEPPTPEPGATAAQQRISSRGARRIFVAFALVAGIVGVALARGSADGSLPRVPLKQASNQTLAVAVSGSWRQRDSDSPLAAGLTNRLGLGPAEPGRGLLVLGSAQASDPNALVQQLTGEPSVPSPQIVSLNGMRFYRYANLVPRASGAPESLYALPTTTGTIVGVCVPQSAGAEFAATCERVLASLKLRGARALGAGPTAAVGSALNRVIVDLSASRATAEKRLAAARTSTAQASAAGALASAYSRAASGLQGLEAGAASSAIGALASAFTSTADAYLAIAHAAALNEAAAYRAANGRLTSAADAVETAIRQLRTLGYEIA